MAFLNKLGDIARNIGDKATDTIEITKLNSKINGEKTAIADCIKQIGEYYYQKHQAGGPDDSEVAELCAAIDGHNQTIADTQAEIARIKAENVAQAQTSASPAEPAAAAAAEVTCAACGKLNTPGTKFCCECGGKLETPTAPAFCPGCGVPVPAGARFCGECGHRFE
jgi:membrane protease subunit (stomatin/prohibitin family)